MCCWPSLLQIQPIANGTLGGEVALKMKKHRLFYCLYPIELGYTNYLHIIYVVKSTRDDLIATGGDMHIACVCTMLYGKLYYVITWASKDFLIYKVPQTKSFVNTKGPKSFLYILLLMLILLKLSWTLLFRHPSRVLLYHKLLVYNHWAYR